jgi:hypothetical protein
LLASWDEDEGEVGGDKRREEKDEIYGDIGMKIGRRSLTCPRGSSRRRQKKRNKETKITHLDALPSRAKMTLHLSSFQ